jgi:hypothetical protein
MVSENSFSLTDPLRVEHLFTLAESEHAHHATILAGGTALSLLIIDVVYALSDVIADIYLLDAAAESGFVCAWIFIYFNLQETSDSTSG